MFRHGCRLVPSRQSNMERQFDARKGAWEGVRDGGQFSRQKVVKQKAISPWFLVGNLPCPNETCLSSLSTYSRYGIDNHYCGIQKR